MAVSYSVQELKKMILECRPAVRITNLRVLGSACNSSSHSPGKLAPKELQGGLPLVDLDLTANLLWLSTMYPITAVPACAVDRARLLSTE